MTITPELAEVITVAIESALLDVHVSIPGKVQKYYPPVPGVSEATVDVEVGIKRALEDENDELVFEELGVLQNVPVVFPRTSIYFMSFPLVPGDTGDIDFSEVNVGQWRASEGSAIAVPDDIGRHTLDGARFKPGFSKDSAALTDTLTDGAMFGLIGGAKVTVKPTGELELKNTAGTGTVTVKTTGQVDINGNFTVDP
jgi:hypothetical protein